MGESVDPQFVGIRFKNEKYWGQKLFKGFVKRKIKFLIDYEQPKVDRRAIMTLKGRLWNLKLEINFSYRLHL